MKSLAAAALACALVSASCGRDEAKGRIAVRVNGEAISVEQVRLQRDATPAHDARQAIESLIDRRLLVQQALSRKLEDTPGVRAALESAREKILVQAYLENLADAHYRFEPNALREFYRSHPQLFAERRVYRLLELTAGGAAAELAALRAKAAEARSLYEIASWLHSRGRVFAIGATTRAAEQIPLALLPAVAAMSEGEIRLFPAEGGVSVIQLERAEPAPISEEDAEPRIRRHFWSKAGAEALAEELKWLRARAAIEYALPQ
jgi:EpsD family peptidyl-prolyl cis-trans isomerase